MTAKERLYASRIGRRAITILDVPKDMREGVLAALATSDRARCEAYAEQAKAIKGHPTKAELLAQAERVGAEVADGMTNPQIAEAIRNA